MKYPAALLSIMILLLFGFSYKEAQPAHNQINKQATAENLLKSSDNFKANLIGKEEVPPVMTKAQGEAVFNLGKNDKSIHYKITVSDLENVNMAHIHEGAYGSDGPIVVWLYPAAPPAKLISGKTNGVLVEGTITSENLAGPLKGKTLKDLINVIKSGNAYVNVHTLQNPAGEIRGQIK